MSRLKLVVLSLFILSFSHVFSQEKEIKLWPDGVPGAINDPDYVESSDTYNNWEKFRKVTDPRIDCYVVDKEKANGTAVVIFPGGGYSVLATGHEGAAIAEWFNTMGISAFVVKYRLPSDRIMKDKSIGPLQDAQRAMRIVRRNAERWNIDPHKIGIIGFSAGGHLASTISTHYNDDVYEVSDATSARPDFSLLIYPVISMDTSITHMGSRINLIGKDPSEALVKRFSNELQVTDQTPPAFMVHSMDDNVVPVQNSINYALAMKKHGVTCELHIYEHGGHGYGLGRSKDTESTWPEACKKWLQVQGLL